MTPLPSILLGRDDQGHLSMNRASVGLLLVVLTVGTLVLRLAGIDFGLPYFKEPDTFVAEHVRSIRSGAPHELDRQLSSCQYPSLLADVCAPLSDAKGEPVGTEVTLAQHLRAASRPWLDVRIVVALLSILAIPATFLVARRFATPAWALFAAALCAFSLLHMFFAQQARPHAALVSITALAIACALWLRRAPSWKSYAASALVAGIAIGMLHNGMFVLASFAAAQWLREDRRRFDPRIVLVAGAALIAFRAFYWFYFDDAAQRALSEDDAAHVVWSDLPIDGSGFVRIARTLWFYEPVLLAFVSLAAVHWLASVRRVGADALVVLAHVVPYLLAFGLFSHTYERFALQLLPGLAVFAAWGACRVQARLGRSAHVFGATCLALLALCACASTKLAWLRVRPSTLDETAAWLLDPRNVDIATEHVYAMPPLDLPVLRTREALRGVRFTPWSIYQWKLAEEAKAAPLVQLRWFAPKPEFGALESGAQLDGYLASFGRSLAITEAMPLHPERERLRDGLRRRGQLLARISPDGDARFSEHLLWAQDAEFGDWPNVFWRVLRARAVGPVIEIYRLE